MHTPRDPLSCERLETIFDSPQLFLRTLTQQSSIPSSMNLPLHTPISVDIEHNSPKPSLVSRSANLSHEIYRLYLLVIPITLGYICEWVPTYISNMFLGHLPNAHLFLAGVGLARMFSNTTALSILWGLLSGLYTVVPQAVGAGDQKFNLLSLYIQRAFYIAILCSIPLIALQFFVSDILVSIGEPSVLSPIMSISCRYLIIHIYASVILTILRRIAQNLQYVNQIMTICMICAFLSYPLNYLFVNIMDLSYVGCVLSIGVNTLLNTILMILMFIYYDHRNIFRLRRCSKVFDGNWIMEYLAMSVPGIFTHSFEWCYYEITVLFAGFITDRSSIALSSSVILHNIFMMIELIGVGISRALTIQIGKYIGANDPLSAKTAIKAGIVVSISMSGWVMIILCVFREDIVKLFTNDERVIDVTKDVMWIAIISAFFIITNHSISGVYHAMGKQKVSAWIIFISYFGFGFVIMLIVLFGFELNKSLLYGTTIIFGMLCFGNVVATLLMQQYLSCFIHWNDVIRDAQNRLQETITKTKMQNYGSCSNNE